MLLLLTDWRSASDWVSMQTAERESEREGKRLAPWVREREEKASSNVCGRTSVRRSGRRQRFSDDCAVAWTENDWRWTWDRESSRQEKVNLLYLKRSRAQSFNGMAYRFIFVSLYEMTVSPSGADIKKTVQVHTHTDVVTWGISFHPYRCIPAVYWCALYQIERATKERKRKRWSRKCWRVHIDVCARNIKNSGGSSSLFFGRPDWGLRLSSQWGLSNLTVYSCELRKDEKERENGLFNTVRTCLFSHQLVGYHQYPLYDVNQEIYSLETTTYVREPVWAFIVLDRIVNPSWHF